MTLKLMMPNLKTLTKELRQEIVSYLYPLPSISSNLAFLLATDIFTKTRFSSHINFISRTGGLVGWASGCYAWGRELDSDPTNTQGLKITEQKVLPL